jgi:ATP-dependent helicase HrpB
MAKRLQSDPELSDVGAVILDEFHERSQHTDLAIAMLYELQELARPDLRLIVMSATLDAERVAAYLGGAPIVRVPGRTFPVELAHMKRPLQIDGGPAFLDSVAETLSELMRGERARAGDTLVFLPGAREIRGVAERVAPHATTHGFAVVELHGSLSLDDQDRAIKKGDRPKIVLATNIAETSLTIDGVGTVVDSGLARVMRVDALGFPRLGLSRISLASATQRAGRAGRQGPGYCYRLWNKLDEASMNEFEQPEILRSDLSEALLALAAQGITEPEGFSWFEKPRPESLRFSLTLLEDLGFKTADGQLTDEGREALKLPVSVRLARLLLEAARENHAELGARIAALLSEKDILTNVRDAKRDAQVESDLLLRLGLLDTGGRGRSSRSPSYDSHALRNVERVAEQLMRALSLVKTNPGSGRAPGRATGWSRGLGEDEIASRLLLCAFPDRLARRRRPKDPAARMVGGRGLKLAPFSTVETADLFLVLDASEPPPSAGPGGTGANADLQVTIASPVSREWIAAHFPHQGSKTSRLAFNPETLAVQKQTAACFRDLPLEEPTLARPNADEAHEILVKACLERWTTSFLANPGVQRFVERWTFAAQAAPDADWPAFDKVRDEVMAEACFGETRLEGVLAKPLAEIFARHLPQASARLLDEIAPESFVVPSGSRIRIHYPEGRGPYLEVRIQEVFGLGATPRVNRGRTPLVFHLLGPNFRPVQVTADLASFWKNGYAEVRKELRARYPKHSWPDDPTTATPQAKGRPRQS